MKKIISVVIVVVLIITIGTVYIIGNSFSIAISRAGYKSHYIVIDADIDDNGDEFKIILANIDENDFILVNMVKNRFGFWSSRN